MNVLMIGGGGREHALAWKLAQSPRVSTVFVAPGNAGTALEPGLQNVAIDPHEFESLVAFARQNDVGLTVVGPEAPLVDGIVDYFEQHQLQCFGPSAKAAQLEGSKSFTKDFLARHNIPTAAYQTFTDRRAAIDYVRAQGAPIVIKADGLAAGKGVIVAMQLAEAEAAINDMLQGNAFGEAGHRVVVEEFLEGEEASFIVVTDGEQVLPMATSQDHKRAGDGDTGPNTGGMGAYSPAPVVTPTVHARIMRDIIYPTVNGLAAEDNRYRGFLYAGLMISPSGEPKVIEYNCRFGDPETQPIMLRLQSDLAELCLATLNAKLDSYQAQWSEHAALGVVLAAGGYPGSYHKGDAIAGLHEAGQTGCKVFHAGTSAADTASNNTTVNPDNVLDDALDNARDNARDNEVLTNGGRVLCVTATGKDIAAAQAAAYAGVKKISWPGMQYRTDIGARAL